MNLLADEGVDRQIVERLRQDGHDVSYVAELGPGTDDDAILAQANAANALLITADKDFGEMVFRRRSLHSGIILVRLTGLSPEAKAGIVASVLRQREAELPGAFCVIAGGTVRIRKRVGEGR